MLLNTLTSQDIFHYDLPKTGETHTTIPDTTTAILKLCGITSEKEKKQ